MANNKIYKKGERRLMRVSIEVFVSPDKDSNHEEMLHAATKEIMINGRLGELPHIIMDMKDITDEDDEPAEVILAKVRSVLTHENLHRALQELQLKKKPCDICHTDSPWHKFDCPGRIPLKN